LFKQQKMKKDTTDRITYLAEIFDVFEQTEDTPIAEKLHSLAAQGYESKIIATNTENVLAIYSTKLNEKDRLLKKVSMSSEVFTNMIIADPTDNKIYLQWIGNLFNQLIKEDKETVTQSAVRLVEEDLPQTNKYLTLFEANKRKRKFIELCRNSYSLKNVTDPTNINQYKSLPQLFDAVDPFIEKDVSAIERTILKFVESGQAIIPVRDRKFTLYIPKTLDASTVFSGFANWCTTTPGNGMFKSYTSRKKPNGEDSNLYIIIDNDFFAGKSKNLYQLHFESSQLKDRLNGSNADIYEEVLSKSEGLSNYFYEELITMARAHKNGLDSNIYIDVLIKFGFAESLFDVMEETTPIIKFLTRQIPRLPDISKFKDLDQLIIINAKLAELHPSVGSLQNLSILSLTNNKLRELPQEIGNLKNLRFLNLNGNPLIEIPSSIKYLDASNGGSLLRLGVNQADIGEKNYKRLQELLPTTPFG
jgi:Leucine-rich repeat (LRR) protein